MKTLKVLLQDVVSGIKAWATANFSNETHVHGNVSNTGKLATASKALITDSNKNITTSSVSETELGYLSGVTSAIQTQINAKADDNSVVHTTGDEGVSGTKSFNSDLNLNYASTDVDDIVNSVAGSAVLDNFVHMTGNETVNGIKSFPDGIVANITGSATSAVKDGSGNAITSTYGSLSGNNTWSGNNAFHNVAPGTTDTYDLGSSSYQWSSVYANFYYYNGTEFQNKFETLDTDQIITGRKDYKTSHSDILPKTETFPSGTKYYHVKRGYAYNDESLTLDWGFIHNSGVNARRWYVYPYSSGDSVYFQIDINPDSSSSTFKTSVKSVIPVSDSATDLGDSSHKWKTFNGLNPGALSLPDLNNSNRIELQTEETEWVKDGTINTYTPTLTGWLNIRIDDTVGDFILVQSGSVTVSKAGTGNISATNYGLGVLIPVISGQYCNVHVKTTVVKAFIYPCLGNVTSL